MVNIWGWIGLILWIMLAISLVISRNSSEDKRSNLTDFNDENDLNETLHDEEVEDFLMLDLIEEEEDEEDY